LFAEVFCNFAQLWLPVLVYQRLLAVEAGLVGQSVSRNLSYVDEVFQEGNACR
jgi:hypothetical protein